MKTLISLNDVNFSIDGKSILEKIDLTVNENEIITIVGPNGAGKSTLLSVILGLQKPTSGQVHQRENLRLAYVPQYINRDPTMPVSVMDFLRLAKSAPKKQEITPLLKELRLSELSRSLINHLSGGELRRVLFARALLNKPKLLILDEPTAGVDIIGQEQFYSQLNELRMQYQFAILMVSHDLQLVMSVTDRIICLNRHVCCHGTPDNILKSPHYQKLFNVQNTHTIEPPKADSTSIEKSNITEHYQSNEHPK